MIPLRIVYLVLFLRVAAALQPVDVKVTVDESSGSFDIFVEGDSEQPWLRSSVVGIRNDGQWWASHNKDSHLLKMTKHATGSGQDVIGEFDTNTWVCNNV